MRKEEKEEVAAAIAAAAAEGTDGADARTRRVLAAGGLIMLYWRIILTKRGSRRSKIIFTARVPGMPLSSRR